MLAGNADRRSFIGFGVVVGAGLACGFPRFASAATSTDRSLGFLNIHTGEKLRATYWANGGFVADGVKAFDHILRDWRTDEAVAMDRELFDLLHGLKTKVAASADAEFQIISGYRCPKTNAMLAARSDGVARKSQHTLGKAIDLRLPGTDLSRLRNAAMAMKVGGVGYYPDSNFVHVDTARVRFW